MISSIIFIVLLISSVFLFSWNVRKIIRNIRLGRAIDRTNNKKERWMVMIKVALGQTKMVARPVAGFFHFIIYIGFIIINIEVLEIITDGILGTHRTFAPYLGNFYNFLIGGFEFLAIGVLIGCVIFLIRRNVIRLNRFTR